ncbi:hypothetical protein BIV25_21035 [Streptomyces sp. MUSC 14]|nr:hypothetical protein BIV25_21035 [Streptomyces sp. MUSC 14]
MEVQVLRCFVAVAGGEYELASNLVRDDVETPGGIKPDLRVSKVRPRVVPVPYGRYGPLVCATCCRHRRTGEPAGCAPAAAVPSRSAPRRPIGPVCLTCHTAVLRSPAECPCCG